MTGNIGNYALHAAIWDWGGYDRTEEHEYWCHYAAHYGKNVLIPFCAIGETGAYMARRGFTVTAFDITPEMIVEGKKRFGNIPGLQFFEGDVRDFHFDIPPADFCFATDFGHIQTIEEVKKALLCINRHLREGGILVIETGLPPRESYYAPPKTFYPKKQVYKDKKVWKTGDAFNDAKTGHCYISQTVYIEGKDGKVEQFDHSFYLQYYPRDTWLSALAECGFEIRHEYCNREKETWREDNGLWIVEAAKKRTYPLSAGEVMYLLREYQGVSCMSNIEWLTADDTVKINEYLILCGQKLVDGDWLRKIYKNGTVRYCLLYVDNMPVARGAVEPYSDTMWEVSQSWTCKRNFAFSLRVHIISR
jgi:SAM-dependent methyltransferase